MSETRVVHVNDNVEGAVYIGRAMPPARGRRRLSESPWANPYKIGTVPAWADGPLTRADAIEGYRRRLVADPDAMALLVALRGKPLACWCRREGEEKSASNACHGDVLVELLNRYSDDELRAMGGKA